MSTIPAPRVHARPMAATTLPTYPLSAFEGGRWPADLPRRCSECNEKLRVDAPSDTFDGAVVCWGGAHEAATVTLREPRTLDPALMQAPPKRGRPPRRLPCVDCKGQKEIRAFNLCSTCYQRARRRGALS